MIIEPLSRQTGHNHYHDNGQNPRHPLKSDSNGGALIGGNRHRGIAVDRRLTGLLTQPLSALDIRLRPAYGKSIAKGRCRRQKSALHLQVLPNLVEPQRGVNRAESKCVFFFTKSVSATLIPCVARICHIGRQASVVRLPRLFCAVALGGLAPLLIIIMGGVRCVLATVRLNSFCSAYCAPTP